MAKDANIEANENIAQTEKTSSKKADKKSKDKAKKSSDKKISRFFKDLKGEFKKVVWPSKKQVKNNTIVAITFMLICGIFLWIIDVGLAALVNWVF